MTMEPDPSIDGEPHLSGQGGASDPSEEAAARRLARDAAGEAQARAQEHSVFNEPAMFAGQDGRPIEQDWSCGKCGYNLRGMVTGHPCPECGNVEIYHPPPPDQVSYGTWLAERQARTSARRSRWVVFLMALVGGPFAILGTFLNAPVANWLASTVASPCLEEIMKIAGVMWLIETRPYLIRHRGQIMLVALVSALLFAVIQNAVYVAVFMNAAGGLFIAWRWVVCTSLHVLCSGVAAAGLMRSWSRCVAERRPPTLSDAWPALLAAMVIHGAYNATAGVLGYTVLLF